MHPQLSNQILDKIYEKLKRFLNHEKLDKGAVVLTIVAFPENKQIAVLLKNLNGYDEALPILQMAYAICSEQAKPENEKNQKLKLKKSD